MAKRLKVLISAYACEPGKGSEPGVGWNVAREMASRHDVWVLTRTSNRPAIAAELAERPIPGLNVAFYDLPFWAKRWKEGGRGVRFYYYQLYYYLWQRGAYRVARRLHSEVGFDVTHHVTYCKYWAPSYLSRLQVPFVWGPVGGGESAPRVFWDDFGSGGRRYERLRELARFVGELDPSVRLTARRSRVALATTTDTAKRLSRVGAATVRVLSEAGLSGKEIARLRGPSVGHRDSVRFVSIGNLLHLKGFHLGLRAFATANLPQAEYWVIGDGPERARLFALARALGVADRVTFFGRLPREQTLERLLGCTALVHPSLHDSGGWVCLEAMAAGRPVVCLDLGGPAVQVTPETGFKAAADTPEQAVRDLAGAMRRLAGDEALRQRMGEAGQRRVREAFTWEHKAEVLSACYREALGGQP